MSALIKAMISSRLTKPASGNCFCNSGTESKNCSAVERKTLLNWGLVSSKFLDGPRRFGLATVNSSTSGNICGVYFFAAFMF